MEGPPSLSKAVLAEAHVIERGGVENVDYASPIHQNLRQSLQSDDGVHDERISPGLGDMLGMIETVEGNSVVRSVKERQDCLPNMEYFTLLEFLTSPRHVVVGPTEDQQTSGLVEKSGAFPFLSIVSPGLGTLLDDAYLSRLFPR
jgi:hypothetical protein